MAETVSVVVPTYNRRRGVERTITSLLAQTVAPQEIIVVDNGSSDGTPEHLAKRFARRVRIRSESRAGAAHARNRGAEAARGGVVAFIDDDAEAAPDWIENILRVMDEESAVAVGGPTIPVYETPPPKLFQSSRAARSFAGDFNLGSARRGFDPARDFFIGTNCAFKRRVFDDGHRFLQVPWGRQRPGAHEDVEFSRRIGLHYHRVYYDPNILVRHHIPARKLTLGSATALAFDDALKVAALKRPKKWRMPSFYDAWIKAVWYAGYGAGRLRFAAFPWARPVIDRPEPPERMHP